MGDKNNLSRRGRGETWTGTFFTGGYGPHGSEWVNTTIVRHLKQAFNSTMFNVMMLRYMWGGQPLNVHRMYGSAACH